LRAGLGRVTSNRWKAFAVGAVATAMLQSSTAVTSLAVSMVDAGLLSFVASLGVVLGANLGTTSTAWLVAFKLTGIGPIFIVIGALLSVLPWRFKLFGQSVFYFGLIFFTLELISASLGPVKGHPAIKEALAYARQPFLGVLLGMLFTVIVQSSSVTTGLAILMVQQGILPAEAAIPIAIGSNAGSPSTALIVSATMTRTARATALANLFFNFSATLVFLLFLRPFSRWVLDVAHGPGDAVALAHFLFNATMSVSFLLLLPKIAPVLERRVITAYAPG
jgi:phosphate:Na+ symporter